MLVSVLAAAVEGLDSRAAMVAMLQSFEDDAAANYQKIWEALVGLDQDQRQEGRGKATKAAGLGSDLATTAAGTLARKPSPQSRAVAKKGKKQQNSKFTLVKRSKSAHTDSELHHAHSQTKDIQAARNPVVDSTRPSAKVLRSHQGYVVAGATRILVENTRSKGAAQERHRSRATADDRAEQGYHMTETAKNRHRVIAQLSDARPGLSGL